MFLCAAGYHAATGIPTETGSCRVDHADQSGRAAHDGYRRPPDESPTTWPRTAPIVSDPTAPAQPQGWLPGPNHDSWHPGTSIPPACASHTPARAAGRQVGQRSGTTLHAAGHPTL